MILSHTLLIAKMARQGKSIEQVMNALRGRYTQEEVEVFWPEKELTPAEKGKATKAANKAKAASTFE